MEIEAKGKNSQGKDVIIDFEGENVEWIPVRFPEYVPSCPLKLDNVQLDRATTISLGKGVT